MEIVNLFLLTVISYYLKRLYFFQILIIFYIITFLVSNFILDSFNNLFGQSINKIMNNESIIYFKNRLIFLNNAYVFGRNRIYFYVGKGLSIIVAPTGLVNLGFLGFNKFKYGNNKVVSKETKVFEPKKNYTNEEVFKSERDMMRFLEHVKEENKSD